MTKALRVGVRSGRELSLMRMLTRGVMDFDDLNTNEKLALYHSTFDIGQVVEEEKIRRFEQEMSLNNAIEEKGSLTELIRSLTDRLGSGRLKDGN